MPNSRWPLKKFRTAVVVVVHVAIGHRPLFFVQATMDQQTLMVGGYTAATAGEMTGENGQIVVSRV